MQYSQHLRGGRMRHLEIYRYIQAIVESGSIRKASERFTISPSALNRKLLAFESELGEPLFERLGVGVRLSAAGEMYYRLIIDHLAAIEGANESLSALKGLRIGHCAVAVSPELTQFLGRTTARFRERHPGVSMTFCQTAHDGFSDALLGRSADLALIAQPVFRPGIETVATAKSNLVAITAQDGPPIALGHLAEYDMIFPPEGTGLRELIDVTFRHQNFSQRPAMVCGAQLTPQTRPRPSLQFWPAVDLPEPARPLARPVVVKLVLARAEGRALPPAAEKLSLWLADALQAL